MLLNGQNTYDCSVTSTTYPPPSADDEDEDEDGRGLAAAPPPPAGDSCTGGRLYTTRVRSGSTVRLRLINASSFLSYWVSVDNHTLTVVELDGVEVEPLAAQRGVYLNVGQRVSVLLTADRRPGAYAIRATLPQTCFLPYAPYVSAGLSGSGSGDGAGEDAKRGEGEKGEEVGGGDGRSRRYEVYGILTYDDIDIDAATGPLAGKPGNTSNPYGVENNGARGDVWEGCDDMPFDVPKPMRAQPAVEVGEANMHYIEYAFRQAQDVNRIFINKVGTVGHSSDTGGKLRGV